MIFEEKTLKSEMIYKGRILNLRRDTVKVVSGETSYREIVEHDGGVTLAAITADNKMVMVRQYRKAAGKAVLEAPAGKREKGEAPLVTAVRELKEETGYTASDVVLLTKFYSSVGYSEEIIYIYLCTGLVPGETDFDDNEALDVMEYDLGELCEMALNGEIEDSKTIIAVLMAKAHLEKRGIQNV
ncbi:MAG: NUDIX hydrolase [Clostridiales bacterium]|nr:NUDIX hydrolase [Clostridiales bacterium]